MTAPIPATITSDLIEQINSLIHKGYFIDARSLDVRRIFAECEKLKKSDAKAAFRCLAALNQACGDEANMRANWKRAVHLGNDIELMMDMMTGLVNLGYIIESHKVFQSAAKPEYGNFNKLLNLGWNILAFNELNAYAMRIENMATDTPSTTFARIHETAVFLSSRGVDDAVIADMAEIAGQVLREHKLFTSNDPVSTTIDKELDCLFIEYELHTTPLEAARIHAEFSNRLAAKYKVIPPHIHIDMVAKV